MQWWEQIKSIFQQVNSSSKAKPIEHEVLSRHRDHADAFQVWKEGLSAKRINNWLSDAYSRWQLNDRQDDEAFDFLDTPSSKGFAINWPRAAYSLEDAEMYQLLLRERVLSKDYRTQVADSRSWIEAGALHRLDRYYLKPRFKTSASFGEDHQLDAHTADQLDQQFGNVLIELNVRQHQPQQLRFSANVYHDRIYQPAEHFAALMQVILD